MSRRMHCLITAGPTYEPLDRVRRLTNFSSGRLGCELANHLVQHGHHVILLIGEQATWGGERRAQIIQTFTSTADLKDGLAAQAGDAVEAVFHAAAVSDFAFGKVWSRQPSGELTEVNAGKIPTSTGALLVELLPTAKIIGHLRDWFPRARIMGWKYEVDGDRAGALAKAREQMQTNRTDGCVANGPAYGLGFGLVTPDGTVAHARNMEGFFEEVRRWLG